jgi:hypothetical protein
MAGSVEVDLTPAESMDDVVRLLSTVVDEARLSRHRRGFFAAVYRQMTLTVQRDIAAGMFQDGERMERFVVTFANRYLGALATFQAGGKPTRAWNAAFECAQRRDRLILQHVVMGINAHVNLDLGIAAAEVAAEDIESLKPDFEHINSLIGSLLDPIQDAIGRFSPLLGLLWRVADKPDDEVLNFSFRVAREEAWKHAVLLSRQPAEDRPALIDTFDRTAALLARVVNDPGGLFGRALVAAVRVTERQDVPAVIDTLLRATAPPAG